MGKRLLLFDDIERNDLDPSGYGESRFVFLNRTARPVFGFIRQILQQWFDEYNPKIKKRENLLRNFRSGDNVTHLSAFFELYLHQLMTRLGFHVEVEPEINGKKPDFLLTAPTGEQLLLEATGVFPDKMYGSAKQLENRILDEINNRVDSPDFFLDITIRNTPEGDFPYAKLCEVIEQELGELDPDLIEQEVIESEQKGFREYPRISWNHDSWDIEIGISPKAKEARGKPDIRPIGLVTGLMETVTTSSSIRNKLSTKYRHYGDGLPIPFVLALDVHDPWFEAQEDVFEALFGTEVTRVVTYTDGTIKTFPDREPDGAWLSLHGFQKTRMSALLVFRRLTPTEIGRATPVLWHHPDAQKPISPDLWKLDQRVCNGETNQYEDIPGHPAPGILGLDQSYLEKLYRLGLDLNR